METDDRTFGEKISDGVAKFGGSWMFIIVGVIFISVWVSLNILSFLTPYHWDEYPFILLNLFLSFVAAFQAPFILMTQRRCEVKQDMIYRSLFREIKELVEADLSLEHEIMERNKALEEELVSVRKELKLVRKVLRRVLKKGGA